MKKIIKWSFLGLCLFVPAYFFWVNLCSTTFLWRYAGTIEEFKKKEQALSFPDQIPSNGKDVTFYYLPHFLQGDAMIRLRFTLPEADFIKLKQNISSDHVPLSPTDQHLAPQNYFDAADSTELSAYTTYLLSPDLETAKRNRNHSQNSGISFANKTFKVIYWFN